MLPSAHHADTVKSVDDASVSRVADLFHVPQFFPQRRDQFARVSRKGNDLLDGTSFQPSHREGSAGGGRSKGKKQKTTGREYLKPDSPVSQPHLEEQQRDGSRPARSSPLCFHNMALAC